jgi:hypothetical protein
MKEEQRKYTAGTIKVFFSSISGLTPCIAKFSSVKEIKIVTEAEIVLA